MYLDNREKERRVRDHPLFLYSYCPPEGGARFVFIGPSGNVDLVGLRSAFRWVLNHTELTYEKNRDLDLEFGTGEDSPLHRSNRFPSEWAAEQQQRRHAGS